MRDKLQTLLEEILRSNIEEKSLINEMNEKGNQFEIISNVDSLDMVSILVDFEEQIQDEYGLNILISSERAMSERGPFSTIESLLDFTMKLIQEENL